MASIDHALMDFYQFQVDTRIMEPDAVGVFLRLIMAYAHKGRTLTYRQCARVAGEIRKPGKRFQRRWSEFEHLMDTDGEVWWPKHNYFIRQHSRIAGSRWQQIRLEVFNRDGYICVYCQDFTRDPECDHIVPISRGGSNDLANLATACRRCNRSKRDKLIEEWL